MAKPYIYLIPSTTVFNPEQIKQFEDFSSVDSQFLYSSLYLNNVEVLRNYQNNYEINFCVDEVDSNCLPDNIPTEKIVTITPDILWKTIGKVVAPKFIQNSSSILFIQSNTMGITQNLLSKALNLLNNEDNNIVLAISASGKVALWGLNYYDEKIFNELDSCDLCYDSFLKLIGNTGNFLFTINGILTIDNLNDFRTLYKILSTKESIEFCSHEKHEMFTHLFIEYKDKL